MSQKKEVEVYKSISRVPSRVDTCYLDVLHEGLVVLEYGKSEVSCSFCHMNNRSADKSYKRKLNVTS